MSVTFEAMLVIGMYEDHAINELNNRLYEKDKERHQQFRKVRMENAGGSKSFTSDVWAACFNHFIPEDVEDCIRKTTWRHPGYVLYVRDLGDYSHDEPGGFSSQTVADLIKEES